MPPAKRPPRESLTLPEREVVARVAAGQTHAMIAEALGVAVKTIESRLERAAAAYRLIGDATLPRYGTALVIEALTRGEIRRRGAAFVPVPLPRERDADGNSYGC